MEIDEIREALVTLTEQLQRHKDSPAKSLFICLGIADLVTQVQRYYLGLPLEPPDGS